MLVRRNSRLKFDQMLSVEIVVKRPIGLLERAALRERHANASFLRDRRGRREEPKCDGDQQRELGEHLR